MIFSTVSRCSVLVRRCEEAAVPSPLLSLALSAGASWSVKAPLVLKRNGILHIWILHNVKGAITKLWHPWSPGEERMLGNILVSRFLGNDAVVQIYSKSLSVPSEGGVGRRWA